MTGQFQHSKTMTSIYIYINLCYLLLNNQKVFKLVVQSYCNWWDVHSIKNRSTNYVDQESTLRQNHDNYELLWLPPCKWICGKKFSFDILYHWHRIMIIYWQSNARLLISKVTYKDVLNYINKIQVMFALQVIAWQHILIEFLNYFWELKLQTLISVEACQGFLDPQIKKVQAFFTCMVNLHSYKTHPTVVLWGTK